MATLSTLDDREVDALLACTSPVDGDLAPVAEVARALRRLAEREPVPPMSEALYAQLASPPLPIRFGRAKRTALLWAAGAGAAAVAVLGAGAAQNRLPAGVQDIVSSTADLVGVDVPRSEERHVEGVGSGRDGSGEGTDSANDGTPGYDGVTPSGVDPADPGVPGDHEPATPATPATSPGANANANPNDQTNSTAGNGPTNSNRNGK